MTPRGRVPGTEIPGREKTEWRPAHSSLSATGPHGPALMVLSQDRPLPAKKWSPSAPHKWQRGATVRLVPPRRWDALPASDLSPLSVARGAEGSVESFVHLSGNPLVPAQCPHLPSLL